MLSFDNFVGQPENPGQMWWILRTLPSGSTRRTQTGCSLKIVFSFNGSKMHNHCRAICNQGSMKLPKFEKERGAPL